MTRRRAEAAFAVLFAVAILLVGGAAIYFVSAISVHPDPAAVPSTAADIHTERYSGAVEESRRLSRSLLLEENLPGLFSLMLFPDLGLAIAVTSNATHTEGVAPLGLTIAEAFATSIKEHLRETP